MLGSPELRHARQSVLAWGMGGFQDNLPMHGGIQDTPIESCGANGAGAFLAPASVSAPRPLQRQPCGSGAGAVAAPAWARRRGAAPAPVRASQRWPLRRGAAAPTPEPRIKSVGPIQNEIVLLEGWVFKTPCKVSCMNLVKKIPDFSKHRCPQY
jgi:hypothetical protein